MPNVDAVVVAFIAAHFGRHPIRRAGESAVAAALLDFGTDHEIREHNPTFGRHEDVARFDISL